MPACTISRDEAVQRWPVEKKAPFRQAATARSRSASSITSIGFLPPISSCSFFMPSAPARAIMRPVWAEPVKEIAAMSGWATIARPTTEPGPMTRLKMPGGQPSSWMMRASRCAVPGTISAGFSRTALPKASAGASFQAGIAAGKFQGVIRPMTPIGSRVTSMSTPGRTEASASPGMRNASPPKKRMICAARRVSAMASLRILPSSRASIRPISSDSTSMRRATRSRRSARASGPFACQAGRAARAACTARSTSPAVAAA